MANLQAEMMIKKIKNPLKARGFSIIDEAIMALVIHGYITPKASQKMRNKLIVDIQKELKEETK